MPALVLAGALMLSAMELPIQTEAEQFCSELPADLRECWDRQLMAPCLLCSCECWANLADTAAHAAPANSWQRDLGTH